MAGNYRDKNGRLHDSKGRFVKDSADQPSQNKNYVSDFMDYESQGVTAPHFGDTRPQFTDLDTKDYKQLDSWYHKNGIANAVVNKPAEDAVRNGWRLVIPSDPDKQAVYQKAMDDLNLKGKIQKEMTYSRLHGDGYLTWGILEAGKQDLTRPIDPHNVKHLAFVHAFGHEYVDKIVANNDPTDSNYGQEQYLVMNPTSTGVKIDPSNGSQVPNMPKPKATVIDASRYAHISNDKLEDDETGNSVLTLNADPIKVLDTALYSAGKILYEYSQKIIHSDNLSREDPQKYREDMHVLSQGFTTESVVTMGTQEQLEKVSTNVSGVQQLFDLAWQVLNTGSKIPKSVLLGEQSGTLAGATQDVQNYYDMVKSIQEQLIKPQLKRIMKLLMWSQDIAGGYEDFDEENIDWDIEFRPLFTPDEKTQSETMANYANVVNTLLTAGVWDIDKANSFLDALGNNQVGAMQNTDTDQQTATDSADDLSPEQIAEYKKELEAVSHGKK